jgi:hypothetical protein
MKDVINRRKPLTLETLQEEIEIPCATIVVDKLATAARELVRRSQKRLHANGGKFDHLF